MSEEEREDLEAKLAQLMARLAERTASIPVHSIRPHQLIEIEELEDENPPWLPRRVEVFACSVTEIETDSSEHHDPEVRLSEFAER